MDHVQTVRQGTLSSPETRQVVVNGMDRIFEDDVRRHQALQERLNFKGPYWEN